MQTKTTEHFTQYNISSKEQFGFGTKLTTGNAVYNLTKEILNVLNKRLIVRGIFCDLE